MNDNRHPTERAALMANVGANGRWFILALVAISLVTGQNLAACFAASILGAACLIEQMRGPGAALFAWALYAWSAILLLWVSVGAAI